MEKEKVILTSLSDGELKEMLNDVVRSTMIDLQQEKNVSDANSEEILLTEDELSKRIHLSSVTLSKYRKQGIIPFVRVGEKRILYDWNKVKKALKYVDQREKLI